MALNLVDSEEIMAAYDAMLANELSWFLLHYPNNAAERIALYAFGSDGLEELKTKIDPDDDEKVVIGLLRAEEVDQGGREREDEVKYVLVSYVPKGVLGVRKARAKVHTRSLGMMFKEHDAVLTAENISQLTNPAIAQALLEPEPSILTFHAPTNTAPPSASPPHPAQPPSTTTGSSTPSAFAFQQQQQPAALDMSRSFSQPPATAVPPSSTLIELRPVKRSYSETYAPPPAIGYTSGSAPSTSPPSHHHKIGSNMFSNLLRRKKRTASASMVRDIDESQESEDSMPPPTPPKDKGIYAAGTSMPERRGHGGRKEDGGMDPHYRHHHHHHHHHHRHHSPTETGAEYMYDPPYSVSATEDRMNDRESLGFAPTPFHHQHSVSEFAVISHEEVGHVREDAGDVVVISPEEFGYTLDKPLPLTQQVSTMTLKRGKWAEPRGLSAIKDPAERARMRMEMQREKEEEEREAIRAEEARQERKRREREEFCKREEEEAERRKLAIQAEALQVAAERRRREEAERLEEERKAREKEGRKKIERQRRLEEHQRLEEWRKEQQRAAEEHARMEREEREKEEQERKERIMKAEGEVKKKTKDGAMTGWVTIQTDESVAWKRRYYKFVQDTLYLFRTAKDTSQAMDILHIRGSVRGLKEPKDGYEDLKAIPFSFAVEFDDRGAWSMFADTEEEKFKLLGLLHHAAGLEV